MGQEAMIEQEEKIGRSGGQMDVLMQSMRMTYADSVEEALGGYEFNFVISDPRLPEHPVVYASDGFCTMSGYSREEVLGRNCRFLQGQDTDRRTVLELRDAIREERSAQVRVLNYTKEGKPFWNLLHLAPVFSEIDGTVVHFVGVQTPLPDQLAAFAPETEMILDHLTVNAKPSLKLPLGIGEFNKVYENVQWEGSLACPTSDAVKPVSKSSSNSESYHNLERSCPGKDLNDAGNGSEDVVRTCLRERGEFDDCKPEEPESRKATLAMRSLVSQLVESSKGKGGVLKNRGKQLSEIAASGVVSSSLMLSLTRIQQSFVLADPHLPDTPIVHASDLFLRSTGYSREEIVGHNCRFLQGPGTDPAAIAQIRDSIRLEKSCSVRLLNYRKDKRPFWNLLHVCPIRSCGGEVSFFVGVQLQVSAIDDVEEEGTGMSAQMKQLSAVGAVRVAVRSLQGAGLRRTLKSATI